MAKPVRLRQLAVGDIDAAVDYYLTVAGDEVAGRFLDAAERALVHVGRHPHHGSLRFAYELDIPDLRAWPLTRFPYLVFYVETDTQIDVWRVLHTRRDIPAALSVDDEE
ncbi:MAG: type II toxin-antitoxin system RelE/ParE family toxin [Ilumatobacteraceae bacterium]